MAANFKDFKQSLRKSCFAQIAKFFSQTFLLKCVLSDEEIKFFRLWAI